MQKFSGHHVLALFLASGCATSFAPSETSTSLTKGPQAITIVDEDEIRLQQLFVRGLTRALVDDHQQAIFLFEQAVQIGGEHAAIHLAMAESYAALKELDTAVYYASRAAELDGENRSYTVYLGELLHRNGSGDETLSLLEDWVAGHPDDVENRLKVADLLAEFGREDEALDKYRNLIEDHGDEMQIQYRMLQLYNGHGDLNGMRSTVRHMLNIDSTNNSLRHLLSEIYIELDSTDAAIGVLEQVVSDDPTDMTTTLSLSKLYRDVGREREAESLVHVSSDRSGSGAIDKMTLVSDLFARSSSDVLAAQRAEELLGAMLEAGIETPDVLYMLGDLRYRSSGYLLAAPLLLRAAELEPRRMDAWTKSALSFLKAGEPERAFAVAEEALILFPGQYALLRVAGQASLRIGRPEEAIDFAAAALEGINRDPQLSDKSPSEMLLLQASAYQILGLPESAEHVLRSALEADEGNVEARYRLILSILDQDGRRVEARDIAKSEVSNAAAHPLFLDAMGWIEHLDGNNEIALGWLQRSVAILSDDAGSHEHLGDVYSALGDLDSARDHWKRALELDPDRVALRAKLKQQP